MAWHIVYAIHTKYDENNKKNNIQLNGLNNNIDHQS